MTLTSWRSESLKCSYSQVPPAETVAEAPPSEPALATKDTPRASLRDAVFQANSIRAHKIPCAVSIRVE